MMQKVAAGGAARRTETLKPDSFPGKSHKGKKPLQHTKKRFAGQSRSQKPSFWLSQGRNSDFVKQAKASHLGEGVLKRTRVASSSSKSISKPSNLKGHRAAPPPPAYTQNQAFPLLSPPPHQTAQTHTSAYKALHASVIKRFLTRRVIDGVLSSISSSGTHNEAGLSSSTPPWYTLLDESVKIVEYPFSSETHTILNSSLGEKDSAESLTEAQKQRSKEENVCAFLKNQEKAISVLREVGAVVYEEVVSRFKSAFLKEAKDSRWLYSVASGSHGVLEAGSTSGVTNTGRADSLSSFAQFKASEGKKLKISPSLEDAKKSYSLTKSAASQKQQKIQKNIHKTPFSSHLHEEDAEEMASSLRRQRKAESSQNSEQSATLNDKLGALVLLMQRFPIGNAQLALSSLLELCRRKNRKAALLGMEALKDLFLEELLPGHRSLKFFHQRVEEAFRSGNLGKRAEAADIEEDSVLGGSLRSSFVFKLLMKLPAALFCEDEGLDSHTQGGVTSSLWKRKEKALKLENSGGKQCGLDEESDAGDVIIEPLKVLLLWRYEDLLKSAFLEYVKVLSAALNDSMFFYKSRVLSLLFELLNNKPEQEKGLLQVLVNKLGDPEQKVATLVSSYLVKIIERHFLMKSVIADYLSEAVWRHFVIFCKQSASSGGVCYEDVKGGRKLSKKSMKRKKKYHFSGEKSLQALFPMQRALLFLSDMQFKRSDGDLPAKLASLYLKIFAALFGKHTPSSEQKDETPAKSGKKKKLQRAPLPLYSSQAASRILRILLTGLNRAYPFISYTSKSSLGKHEFSNFQGQLDTLYLAVHTLPAHSSRIALLHLILKIIKANGNTSDDRFHRVVYEKLLQKGIFNSKNTLSFLLLLRRCLSDDSVVVRVLCILKRLLQVTLNFESSVMCASSLKLVDQFFKKNANTLRVLLSSSDFMLQDSEENFRDVSDSESEEEDGERQKEQKDGVSSLMKRKSGGETCHYDPFKRDPRYSRADESVMWELLAASLSFNPLITKESIGLIEACRSPPKEEKAVKGEGSYLHTKKPTQTQRKASHSMPPPSVHSENSEKDLKDVEAFESRQFADSHTHFSDVCGTSYVLDVFANKPPHTLERMQEKGSNSDGGATHTHRKSASEHKKPSLYETNEEPHMNGMLVNDSSYWCRKKRDGALLAYEEWIAEYFADPFVVKQQAARKLQKKKARKLGDDDTEDVDILSRTKSARKSDDAVDGKRKKMENQAEDDEEEEQQVDEFLDKIIPRELRGEFDDEMDEEEDFGSFDEDEDDENFIKHLGSNEITSDDEISDAFEDLPVSKASKKREFKEPSSKSKYKKRRNSEIEGGASLKMKSPFADPKKYQKYLV